MLRDRLRLKAPIRSVRLLDRESSSTLDAVIRSRTQSAFEAGVAAGLQQGIDSAAARLEQAVECIDAQREEASKSLGSAAIELAMGIARSILKREQMLGNYDMERIVREALHESGVGRGACSVHLNPTDYEALRELNWRSGTRLEADEGIAPGDVQVETSLGLLVRDAMTSLDTIKRNLIEEAA